MQKLLIVDDEAFSREAIAETINWEEYQMQVICASNGKEALNVLMEDNVDILLTDIKMPEMSGLELLAEVHKLGIDIEVIVLSSYNEFDLVRQAMRLGTCDYLFKPTMLPNDIIESVQKAANKQKEKEIDKKAIRQQTNIYNTTKGKEAFLLDLMNGRKMEEKVFDKKIQELQLFPKVNGLVIIVFKIIKYLGSMAEIFENDNYLMKASVCNVINETLGMLPNHELISNNFNEYIVIAWSNDSINEENLINQIDEALQKIVDFMEKFYKIDFAIGISNIGNQMKDINQLYKEASFEADKGDLDHKKVHYANDFGGNTLLMREILTSLDYIKEKLSDKDLSLQMVADYIGVSKNYYSKAFKEVTKVNFIDYVTKLRVEKARNLYINSDLKIYEIAEKVGYSDWHYLYSVYKKLLGHSMSQEKR
ncbi:MAG: response regulator [Firmicutes bacterium]|nr:response regulator [Bacillota bacterium]